MIVVSDTSPLTYLLQINQLLKNLFGLVFIPPAVLTELNEMALQQTKLKSLLSKEWIRVKSPSQPALQKALPFDLDKGETEALALALDLSADYIIIDERRGNDAANKLHLHATGLIGIFIAAKNVGIISAVKPFLDQVISLGFYISKKYYAKVLIQVNE